MKDWSVTISEFSLHTSLCKNPLQLSRMCLALNMKNWYSNMCVCKSGLWEIWAASLYRTCLASSPFPFTHTQLHQMSVHSKPNRQNEMPLAVQKDASLNSGADTFMLLVEDFRTDLCEMKVMIWRGVLHLLITVHPTYEAVWYKALPRPVMMQILK